MGKIRLAAAAGEPIPAGWACDKDGVPTTDPAMAIAGMLLPAGGAKGFGLAMMIDLLTGGLSSGAIGGAVQPLYGDSAVPYNCAHLFLAIRIDAFGPRDDIDAEVASFTSQIRSSKPAPGIDRVRIPGDPAAEAMGRNAGTCHLPAATIAALADLARRLSVTKPQFLNNCQG